MQNNMQEMRGGTICLSKAGLTIASTASKVKIAAPNGAGVDYAIDGILYHKADTDNITFTALAQQADLTTCLYLVQINANGDVSMKKGTEVLTANLTNGDAVLDYPLPDEDNCALGYIKVATDGGTFTAGTTNLSDAAVTDTYYDVMLPPVRPRTS